ncbi:chromate transporter [Symbiobacterium terraclitae]|jgi:chromate transporter|uniref:Chromate transporter n=1 Tax=Symbiobacterium terraclitae TaxID=557451 RepID=A0ABS4JXF9_9FIRM|nr:chromate transporter [Symbiobacterium terraclitae]MBP2019665.1 chromate transporter [Symbiobacterium terraclitae]
MMWKTLLDLFIGFSRATLLGFGGGPSIVPLYEHEAVEVFSWVSREEFGTALAMGNALPGPIATKLTMYIGYRVAGWPGALVSLIAVTLPVGVVMVALAGLMVRFKDSPVLKGMVAGIRPVVFVMLAMLAMDFAGYAFQPRSGAPVNWLPFAIAAAFFISVHYMKLSPIYGVVGALLVGALFLR